MALTATNYFFGQPDENEEDAFWTSLQLPNRTFKTTVRKRLDDLNRSAIEHWTSVGFAPRDVLDVGVSSGVTSIEWLEAMESAHLNPRMVATDLTLNAKIVHLLPFYRILVRDSEKMEPLQHDLFGWPLIPYFNFGVRSSLGGAITFVLYRLLNLPAMPGKAETPVLLVSPRAKAGTQITFVEDDIFDANTKERLGKFDVVRAANLLNTVYFSGEKLRAALANIKSLLKGPGSFLIVVKTIKDGSNHGTMFRLTEASRFEPVLSVGNGSEISELVLAA